MMFYILSLSLSPKKNFNFFLFLRTHLVVINRLYESFLSSSSSFLPFFLKKRKSAFCVRVSFATCVCLRQSHSLSPFWLQITRVAFQAGYLPPCQFERFDTHTLSFT